MNWKPFFFESNMYFETISKPDDWFKVLAAYPDQTSDEILDTALEATYKGTRSEADRISHPKWGFRIECDGRPLREFFEENNMVPPQLPSIGTSNFCMKRSVVECGNSYTTLQWSEVVDLVRAYWGLREPGTGESNTDRKVLVPIPFRQLRQLNAFFCQPRANIVDGLNVRAAVTKRQDGEDPYIETFVTPEDARAVGALVETEARNVKIVVYSAEALCENGGTRTTDDEWEIVCLICEAEKEETFMPPLTMARNYLQKEGGTFTDYTAKEFAEAIWHNSIKKGIKVRDVELPKL